MTSGISGLCCSTMGITSPLTSLRVLWECWLSLTEFLNTLSSKSSSSREKNKLLEHYALLSTKLMCSRTSPQPLSGTCLQHVVPVPQRRKFPAWVQKMRCCKARPQCWGTAPGLQCLAARTVQRLGTGQERAAGICWRRALMIFQTPIQTSSQPCPHIAAPEATAFTAHRNVQTLCTQLDTLRLFRPQIDCEENWYNNKIRHWLENTRKCLYAVFIWIDTFPDTFDSTVTTLEKGKKSD